jgi:hypothetical protein
MVLSESGQADIKTDFTADSLRAKPRSEQTAVRTNLQVNRYELAYVVFCDQLSLIVLILIREVLRTEPRVAIHEIFALGSDPKELVSIRKATHIERLELTRNLQTLLQRRQHALSRRTSHTVEELPVSD